MDGRLSYDVYALITDPRWRVEHEAYDKRVSVVIGGPENESPPINLLQLRFKEPAAAVSLGQELMTAGMRLAAQLRTPIPEVANSNQNVPDEHPKGGAGRE